MAEAFTYYGMDLRDKKKDVELICSMKDTSERKVCYYNYPEVYSGHGSGVIHM